MSAGVRTRGSLGSAERMEVWLGGGNGPDPDGTMAMDFEELAARAVKWKGISSSASMVDPQEHKKGSGAQMKGHGGRFGSAIELNLPPFAGEGLNS